MKLKSIYRLEQSKKGTKGYQVQIKWKGKLFSKYFADSKCGGMKGALLSAVSWRDAREIELDKRRSENIIRAGRTSTGVSGVVLTSDKRSYAARWTKNGRQHIKSFSIKKYGKIGALKKACEVREDKVVDMLLSK